MKFLVYFCIAAAHICYTEAATGYEVYSAIQTIGSEIRYEEASAILTAVKETAASANTPEHWTCIRSQVPLGYRELNNGLGREQNTLRKEYGLLTPEMLEPMEVSAVQEQIRRRLTGAVSNIATRISAIRSCVQ